MSSRTTRFAVGVAALALGVTGLAAPAHASAPTVSLDCESGASWFCDATPSGALGSLQWFFDGYHDPSYDNEYAWSLSCSVGQIEYISVLYTDPSGAQATARGTLRCLQYTP